MKTYTVRNKQGHQWRIVSEGGRKELLKSLDKGWYISKVEEKKILNVGCGDDFYGTDRIDIVKTPATTKVGNIEKGLPYPSNYFDEVYASCVFEHMRNAGFFLEECYRVLKKGGVINLITDNAGFIGFHIKGHYHGEAHELNNHYALYTPEHLKYHFFDAGFKRIDLWFSYHEKYPFFQKVLTTLFGNRFGRARMVVRAEK